MSFLMAHDILAIKVELARGEMTQTAIAEDFDVDQSRISQIAKKYKHEIAEMRQNLADEFVGLWAAQKRNRIAHYEQMVETLDELLAAEPSASDRVGIVRARQMALKSIAEEMGQLGVKIDVGEKLNFLINGVNPTLK